MPDKDSRKGSLFMRHVDSVKRQDQKILAKAFTTDEEDFFLPVVDIISIYIKA